MSNVNNPGNRGKRKVRAQVSDKSLPADKAGKTFSAKTGEAIENAGDNHGFKLRILHSSRDIYVGNSGPCTDVLDMDRRCYTQTWLLCHEAAIGMAFRAGYAAAVYDQQDAAKKGGVA